MDEDSQALAQLNLLRADGHDVVAIGELGKNGTADPEVFDLAQSLERLLLTHNAEDFHALHRERPGHQGIIAVYRDADPRKNMNRGRKEYARRSEYQHHFEGDLQARHDRDLPALRVKALAALPCRVRFRYNNRVALEINDKQRADNILDGVTGKRLTYQTVS